jgi:hypothetical protein
LALKATARGVIRSVTCLLVLIGALATPASAQQASNYRKLMECSHQAAIQFKRHDPSFRRFIIDRGSVVEDRYNGNVGNQYVSTVFHGTAIYDSSFGGPKRRPFVCLHAGFGKGAVFVYALPE